LMTSQMLPTTNSAVKEPAGRLLERIASGSDPTQICWSSSELLSRLHEDQISLPTDCVEILMVAMQNIAGPGAIEGAPTWKPPVRGRPLHANRVLGGGPSLAAAFQPFSLEVLEASSSLLLLLHSLLLRKFEDIQLLRQHLLEAESGKPSSFWFFLRILATETGMQGASAFVHCCQVLALVADAQEDVARALRAARVLQIVSDRLLGSLDDSGPESLGPEWLPFATAAVRLTEVLVSVEDSECLRLADPSLYVPAWAHAARPDRVIESVVQSLRRSLIHERGFLVAQALHLSGLEVLRFIATTSRPQAQRMLSMQVPELAVSVLMHEGSHEEVLVRGLQLLNALAPGSPFGGKAIAAAGAADAAVKAAKRYPRSMEVQQESLKILQTCDSLTARLRQLTSR